MHSAQRRTGALFIRLGLQAVRPAGHALRLIRPIVKAALVRVSSDFAKRFATGGQTPIAAQTLLPELVPQTFHAVLFGCHPMGLRAVTVALLVAMPLAASAFPPEAPRDDPVAIEAVRLLETGRYDLSVPMLESVLARLPGDPDILTYLALALRRTGRLAEAEARYDEALSHEAAHLPAIAYQGVLFLETGRRDRAEANLRRLEALCPIGCSSREDLSREVALRR